MNEIAGPLLGVMVGVVVGLIFISPVMLVVWIIKRRGTKNQQKVVKEMGEKHPNEIVVAVRMAKKDNVNNFFKMKNFDSSGVLVIGSGKVKYIGMDKENFELIFDGETMDPEWVGPLPASGWVLWFNIKDNLGETYYFAGTDVNWRNNQNIFKLVVTKALGKPEIEAEKSIMIHKPSSYVSWFYIIGALTLVNSVLSMSGSEESFVLGLVLVQFVGEILEVLKMGSWGGVAVSFAAAIGFVYLGKMAEKKVVGAYKAGIGVLVVDSLFMLALVIGFGLGDFSLILNVALRALAINSMYQGMRTIDKKIPAAKSGFTLIEIMVTVSIIGVVSIGGLVALNAGEVREKATDAQVMNIMAEIFQASNKVLIDEPVNRLSVDTQAEALTSDIGKIYLVNIAKFGDFKNNYSDKTKLERILLTVGSLENKVALCFSPKSKGFRKDNDKYIYTSAALRDLTCNKDKECFICLTTKVADAPIVEEPSSPVPTISSDLCVNYNPDYPNFAYTCNYSTKWSKYGCTNFCTIENAYPCGSSNGCPPGHRKLYKHYSGPSIGCFSYDAETQETYCVPPPYANCDGHFHKSGTEDYNWGCRNPVRPMEWK
jgi:prepilin-type N-terminal cleavage/methylation domain-containing protein